MKYNNISYLISNPLSFVEITIILLRRNLLNFNATKEDILNEKQKLITHIRTQMTLLKLRVWLIQTRNFNLIYLNHF